MADAGPAVAWNTDWAFSEQHARRFTREAPFNATTAALTAHWYAGRATRLGTSVASFLTEAKMTQATKLFRTWVSWATAAGLPFRLEESNTLCEGGLLGASDTLAAALYVLDLVMSLIKAGVSGLNLHGTMCYSYSPILFPSLCDPEKVATANSPLRGMGASCPADCGRKGAATAVVGAPFYGMVLAQMALEGLPDMIMVPDHDCAAAHGVKVHTLSAERGGELRLVLIKKAGDQPLLFNITVTGLYDTGTLTVLNGPNFMSTVSEITLAGQKIGKQGSWTGQRSLQKVSAVTVHTTRCCEARTSYAVPLPAAGASLLVVRRLVFM